MANVRLVQFCTDSISFKCYLPLNRYYNKSIYYVQFKACSFSIAKQLMDIFDSIFYKATTFSITYKLPYFSTNHQFNCLPVQYTPVQKISN